MGNPVTDPTWGHDWTSSGNTATNTATGTTTGTWFNRLRGPRYALSTATLVLRQTGDNKPEIFANIGGVQFKRTTRRGRLHYYRTVT